MESYSPDLPASPIQKNNSNQDGYWWKSVFLPTGTKLKMTYRGRLYAAEVAESGVIFDGKAMSPSNFVFHATGTTRNAWTDKDVLFPDSHARVLADKLRIIDRDSSDIV